MAYGDSERVVDSGFYTNFATFEELQERWERRREAIKETTRKRSEEAMARMERYARLRENPRNPPLPRKPRRALEKELVGRVFDRLTVIEYAGKDALRNTLWKCRCSCGGVKVATRHNLEKGRVRSCGCLQKENIKKAREGK